VQLLSNKKPKPVVGLDVEAGSVAAAEISVNGHAGVGKFGILPLEAGVFREGEVTDPAALGEALKQLFSKGKLSKNVRIGLASQRVAVRTLRLPEIGDDSELETAIRFQAQEHIPMPLENAVLDWQVVGRSEGEVGERQIEVVVVAARRDMLGGLIDAVRRAGLQPEGIDLSAFGMIRALAHESYDQVPSTTEPAVPADEAAQALDTPSQVDPPAASPAAASARLYCNLGDVTNLAVARGAACLFTRISPFGVEGIAQKLAERRELTLEHSRQWLSHVGLSKPIESVEGDPETLSAARDALTEGAARLVDELRLSLEYYAASEGAIPIDGIVACGPGTTIPGLVERLQHDLGQRFEIGRPKGLSHLDRPTAARLTMSFGLALEE
jgi:type IV pilus assembly protein PilM